MSGNVYNTTSLPYAIRAPHNQITMKSFLARFKDAINAPGTTKETARPASILSKYDAEIMYWKIQVYRIINWYNGDLPILCGIPAPSESEKIVETEPKDSAILTWHRQCSEAKYLSDLGLKPEAFVHCRILDVGLGPISGATAFTSTNLYCLDPLLPQYLEVGFPLHYYDARFVHAFSETMPLPDNCFDAVIAVNSIDHVDNFERTAKEIQRVLKPQGKLAIHAYYHPASTCEPIELNDERFYRAFDDSLRLRRVSESDQKLGYTLSKKNEKYVLWQNF